MRKESVTVRYLAAALCLLVPIIYWLLHLRYRIDNVDDAWSFAWAYQWQVNGVIEDIVFRGGTQLEGSGFSMLYRLLYGWVGAAFGWTKSNAHLVSTVLVVGASALWTLALKKLGYKSGFCLLFGLLFLLVEPIFGAANQARTDALSLVWIAAAVWSASRRSGLGVGFFTILAFENHPAAAVHAGGFGLAVLGYSIFSGSDGRVRRAALQKVSLGLIAGTAIGGLLYFGLHYNTLGYLTATFAQARRMEVYGVRNYFFSYFFLTRYLRHIPELVLLLLIFILAYRRNFYRRARLEALLLGVALAASVLIARPNFHYVAFAYPAFLLLFLSFGDHWEKLGLMAAGLGLFFTLQYCWVYWQQGNYDFREQTSRLSLTVADDDLPVFGTAEAWFAFYDRDFRHLSVPEGGLPATGRGFYLVRKTPDRYALSPTLERLLDYYSLSRISDLKFPGGIITVDKAIPVESEQPAPE
jgi:hypothetical protein